MCGWVNVGTDCGVKCFKYLDKLEKRYISTVLLPVTIYKYITGIYLLFLNTILPWQDFRAIAQIF